MFGREQGKAQIFRLVVDSCANGREAELVFYSLGNVQQGFASGEVYILLDILAVDFQSV
jgi:hypothetical protein